MGTSRSEALKIVSSRVKTLYSIVDVWNLDDQQLQSILAAKNQKLSGKNLRDFDRTVVATIIYNEGKLDAESALLVEHPMFNGVYAYSGTLEQKLNTL